LGKVGDELEGSNYAKLQIHLEMVMLQTWRQEWSKLRDGLGDSNLVNFDLYMVMVNMEVFVLEVMHVVIVNLKAVNTVAVNPEAVNLEVVDQKKDTKRAGIIHQLPCNLWNITRVNFTFGQLRNWG